jgi:serine/threonine protein phosphatase PrpC
VAEHLADGSITPDQAAEHPNRHIITRNLGQLPYAQPDVGACDLHDGDRLLLCTDGLWGVLGDERIAELAQSGKVDRVVERLIADANAAGGPDNIAVALICVGANGERRGIISSIKDFFSRTVSGRGASQASARRLSLPRQALRVLTATDLARGAGA